MSKISDLVFETLVPKNELITVNEYRERFHNLEPLEESFGEYYIGIGPDWDIKESNGYS